MSGNVRSVALQIKKVEKFWNGVMEENITLHRSYLDTKKTLLISLIVATK